MSHDGWNQAVITGDELRPVQEILSLVRDARSRADRILRESEQEYQSLRSSVWTEDSESARRFYWLRWQRDALSRFVNEQQQVTENLWTETNNVWQESDLLDSGSEGDVIILETATAA